MEYILNYHHKENNAFLFLQCCIYIRQWMQPRCPSADKWIRKLWYIYTMEYYSAIKKNSFESVWSTYYDNHFMTYASQIIILYILN